MVLDDYHLVRDPAVHVAIVFLLDHLPPSLHLVIAVAAPAHADEAAISKGVAYEGCDATVR